MKKLIIIGIAAVMVTGLAVAATAAIDDTWGIALNATNESLSKSQGVALFGTQATGATDPPTPSRPVLMVCSLRRIRATTWSASTPGRRSWARPPRAPQSTFARRSPFPKPPASRPGRSM